MHICHYDFQEDSGDNAVVVDLMMLYAVAVSGSMLLFITGLLRSAPPLPQSRSSGIDTQPLEGECNVLQPIKMNVQDLCAIRLNTMG